MVNSFILSKIPRIIFGAGNLARLPDILKEYGDTFIIVTGASSFRSGAYGRTLFKTLENSECTIFNARIVKEPSPLDIDEIVSEYFQKKIDAVAGIGGGSVLDTAKAVSAMLKTGGTVRDYIEGVGSKTHPGVKIPFIAVPTTAGTGSETTGNAVICEIGENGFKKSLRHPNFVPDVALVDPELTLGCPPEITTASGMDALTQLIESYVSVKSSIVTDSLAIEAIGLIINNLPEVYRNGGNIKVRSAIAYGAMISGITLANAGLGVVHGFASSIGGMIDIPHGALCGTLLGAANRIIVNKLLTDSSDRITLKKYARLGSLFSTAKQLSDSESAHYFVELLDKLVDDLKLPVIGRYGLKKEQIPGVVEKTSQKNNPVTLDKHELEEILLSRI